PPNPQRPVLGSMFPPLLKQSIASMQSPTLPLFEEHAALQVVKRLSRPVLPPQSRPKPLTPQLSARAVSWRTSWSRCSPRGLTHMAWRTELLLPTESGVAVSMAAPQISTQPPLASSTVWLAVPCVFQKPGVRQVAWHSGLSFGVYTH